MSLHNWVVFFAKGGCTIFVEAEKLFFVDTCSHDYVIDTPIPVRFVCTRNLQVKNLKMNALIFKMSAWYQESRNFL